MKTAKLADVPAPRVTLKFLAQRLGLSRTTISVVLNDAPQARSIPLQTRERILCEVRILDRELRFTEQDQRLAVIGLEQEQRLEHRDRRRDLARPQEMLRLIELVTPLVEDKLAC